METVDDDLKLWMKSLGLYVLVSVRRWTWLVQFLDLFALHLMDVTLLQSFMTLLGTVGDRIQGSVTDQMM